MTNLSVEVCHLYVHRMTEATIRAAAEQAKQWVLPVLAQAGPATVSVFLDDYTRPRRSEAKWASVQVAQETVVRVFDEVGLQIDYVVMEAACAETVGHLKAMLAGAGQVDTINRGWLSNGEPARHQLEASKRKNGRHAHPIALDVQLWSTDDGLRWACPMVAAWWQLMRLGALSFFGLPLPSNTWQRPGALPLEAEKTLTVLSVDYLEVEHAVQSILRYVSFGDATAALTDRVSYIFIPEVR